MPRIFGFFFCILFFAGCAGIQPGVRRSSALAETQLPVYADYGQAYYDMLQENYQKSLQLCRVRRNDKILYPQIQRLMIKNLMQLKKYDEIEPILEKIPSSLEDQMLRAQYFVEVKRFDDAGRILEDVLEKTDDIRIRARVIPQLLDTYANLKAFDLYVPLAVELIKSYPQNYTKLTSLTFFNLLKMQRLTVAQELILEVAENKIIPESDYMLFMVVLIRLYEENKLYDAMQVMLRRSLELYPDSVQVALTYGRYFGDKDPDYSRKLYRQFLPDFPQDVLPYYMRFTIQQKDWSEFQKLAEKYEKECLSNPDLSMLIGSWNFDNDRYAMAEKWLENTCRIQGENLQALGLWISCQFILNKKITDRLIDRVLAYWDKKDDQEMSYSFLLSIDALGNDLQREKLISSMRRSSITFPKKYLTLCQILRGVNRDKEALEVINEGLIVHPENQDLLIEKGYMLYQAEDEVGAEKIFMQLIEGKTENAFVYNNLAYMWAERGANLPKAIEYAEKALALSQRDASILDTLGWLYFLSEQPEKARPLLEESGAKLKELIDRNMNQEEDVEVLNHLIQFYEKYPDKKQLEYWNGLRETHFQK